jgi:hypothetical protein
MDRWMDAVTIHYSVGIVLTGNNRWIAMMGDRLRHASAVLVCEIVIDFAKLWGELGAGATGSSSAARTRFATATAGATTAWIIICV